MIEPENLTRTQFREELAERVDALRLHGVEVPLRLDQEIITLVGGRDNPFDHDLFRMAAVHLLDGLDPEMAEEDGGVEMLEERLCALPVNLGVSLRIAAERHEQPV
ncbi:MAG: hypothetical protein ACYDCH_00190 [Gaiellaceae bacterium]